MEILWRFCVTLASVIMVSGAGKRPNIVFILTDDQDVTMNGLTPLVNTVSLIGKQGMTFKNMFTTSPLCCPSRSSILTGNYVHNHKAYNNSISGGCSDTSWQNGPEKTTIATYLRGMGYKTFFAGKYLNQYGEKAVGGVAHVPPGWDEWNGLVGNSVYYNYTLSVNGKAEAHGADYHADYLTDLINNRSHEFLEKQDKTTPPFFVMVSTPACHSPFDSAPQYVQNYTKNAAPRGPSFNKAGADKHWLIRKAPNPMSKDSVTILDDVFRKRWRTLLSVDDMVKNIVDTLDSKKLLDSTYIIFSSDNGYHLGQFSLPMDKRQLYEFDIRVPLLIRGPNIKAGSVTDYPALNIDILPTIVQLAGDPAPQNVDGLSLVPFLIPNTTETGGPSRDCLIEHSGEYKVDGVKGCSNSQFLASPAVNRDFLIEHEGEWFPLGDFGCKNVDHCANCNPDCVCEDSKNNTFSCVRSLHPGINTMYCELSDGEQCSPDCVCEDSKNNTYSCVRHIDTKSNHVYCELVDDQSFQEYYDLNKDPHQLTNTVKTVPPADLAALHKQLILLQLCKGNNCRQLIPPDDVKIEDDV